MTLNDKFQEPHLHIGVRIAILIGLMVQIPIFLLGFVMSASIFPLAMLTILSVAFAGVIRFEAKRWAWLVGASAALIFPLFALVVLARPS